MAEDLLGTMVSVKTGIMGTYDNIFYIYLYILGNIIYILGSKSLGIPIIGGLIHVHTRDRLSHLCFPRSFILTHIQIKGGELTMGEVDDEDLKTISLIRYEQDFFLKTQINRCTQTLFNDFQGGVVPDQGSRSWWLIDEDDEDDEDERMMMMVVMMMMMVMVMVMMMVVMAMVVMMMMVMMMMVVMMMVMVMVMMMVVMAMVVMMMMMVVVMMMMMLLLHPKKGLNLNQSF